MTLEERKQKLSCIISDTTISGNDKLNSILSICQEAVDEARVNELSWILDKDRKSSVFLMIPKVDVLERILKYNQDAHKPKEIK